MTAPRDIPSIEASPRAPDSPKKETKSGKAKAGNSKKRRKQNDHVYAALDLGTNNCRLMIARPDGDSFKVLDAFSRVVRLGEGVEENNALSPAAMDRAIAALKICADKMAKRNVTRARAIATEACRRAVNGSEFVERVVRETGLTLDVIGAGDEARLAVAGCAPLFDTQRDCLLVFDIGGGSTEIVWIDLAHTPKGRRRDILLGVAPKNVDKAKIDEEIRILAESARWTSLPVGVVTLAEKYKNISNEQDRFNAMRAFTNDLIAPFAADGAGATPDRLQRMQLLGTSGTITTLAGVHLDLPRYNRVKVDGLWIARTALTDVIDRLIGMDRAERATIPCIGDDRAELVISGSSILSAIMDHWPTEQLRVADRGLREGLLYGLMNRDDSVQSKQEQ